MGTKRSFDEGDYPEPSFKQPRPLQYSKKSSSSDIGESHLSPKSFDYPVVLSDGLLKDILGETRSDIYKFQIDRGFEDGGIVRASIAEKQLEASEPLFLVTSRSNDEDGEYGNTSVWSSLPRYVELSIPRKSPEPYIDPYITLLNSSSKKDVLIGTQHQAEVPLWEPNASCSGTSCDGNSVENDREQRLLGTCIISLPDLNDCGVTGVIVGRGRTNCSCLDAGSMRCVQQHVKEARENFLLNVGEDKFVQLGFLDMGEEVASKWTSDEERVFHEVVFSNPASHGRNFWKHLRDAFPTRRMKELVSYYFNVLMLHRRAVQNRSFFLEIDSDDDEECSNPHQNRSHSLGPDCKNNNDHQQCQNGDCSLLEEDDDDSTVESFDDQDLDADASWVDEFWSEPENVCRVNMISGENGTSECITEKHGAVEMSDGAETAVCGREINKSYDECSFDS